jgi:hypothetical protein
MAVWTCPGCGTTAQEHQAACGVCGLPRDGARKGDRTDTAPGEADGGENLVAPAEIARKVRRARLVRDPGRDLMRRGFRVGFLVGGFFSAVLIGLFLYRWFTDPNAARRMSFELLFLTCVLLTALVCPFVCCIGALLLGGLLKPIFTALFASPEEFERQYGPSGTQPNRPRHRSS